MGMNTAAVQRLYVAYFNRPADPVSLAVYEAMLPTDRVATQAELQVIAETYFSPSAEYTTNFAGKSNSQIVDQLYQNIFGRTAEADGLISWASKLTDGSITVAELALQLSYSAQGTDASVVDARIEAATTFTDALDTTAEITGYSGNAAAASGKVYLAQISGDLPTTTADITAQKDAAIAGVDTSVASAVNAGNGVAGETITLTTGLDAKNGTAGDDTFNAVLQAAGATGSTASPGDVVNGGDGTDTFALSVAGDAGGAHTLQAVQLSSVENVLVTNFDLNTAATTIDTSLMAGVTKVGLASSAATGDTVFSGMTSIIGAQMSNGAGDLTMTYAAGTTGTADTQNLAVSAASAGTFNADGIETVAVTGSLAASKLTNITGSTLKAITIGGDQNFTMTGSTTVKTIDASANTGKTSLVLGAADQTVTGGAGDDTIDIGANLTAADAIQGGEGTDTLKISASGTVNGMASAADVTAEFALSGGFEVIDIASTNDAATLALANIAGVETVKAAANTKTVAFTGDAGNQTATSVAFTLNGVSYTSTVDLSGNAAADALSAANAVAATINAVTGFTATSDGTDTVTITNTSGERVDISVTDQTGATAVESAYTDVTVSGITTQSLDIFTADKVTGRMTDPSGEADVLNINLKTVTADSAATQTITEIDIADTIETVNLDATGMKTGVSSVLKTVTTLTSDSSLTTLNITGSDDLTIGTLTAAKLATINAGTATGSLSLPSNTGTNIAQAITTGSGNDTIAMGSQLTGADVIDTGGNSAITAAGKLGVDTVTASGNLGTTVASEVLQISNAEVIQLTVGGAAASYIDGSKLSNVGEIAFSSTAGPMNLTNMPAGTKVGLGIADVEGNATITYTLADATGTDDALSLNYSDTLNAGSSNTLVTTGIEVLNVSAEKAGSNTSTLVNTNMTAGTINITDGVSTNTVALGSLNKATTTVAAGTTSSKVTLTQANAVAMDVTANGSVVNNITLSTKGDTVTLTKELGTVIQVIAGGASATASAADTVSATVTSTATDFTSISGFEVVNLTVKSATDTGFDDATKNDGVENASTVNILGGNSNSTFTIDATAKLDRNKTSAATAQTIDASGFSGTTTLNFGTDDLDIFTTVTGGTSALDAVTTTISDAASSTAGNNPTMSGIEYLTVNSTDGDTDAVINLGNATGLARVTASFATAGAADQIEIDSLAAGVQVYVAATNATDNLDIGLASTSGASDAVTVVSTANNSGLNLDAAGVEVLAINSAVNGSYDLAGVSPTTGEATTVNLTGAGNVTITALNTGITEINGASMGGALNVAASARDDDAITITGGVNNDSIAMENAADVLAGGSQAVGGSDTLVLDYSAVLGGVTADLSAADQVVSMDGSPNTAVQSGFENIDLRAFSGFGSVVTGSDGANVITGTAGDDRITAGKGDDTIQVALTNDANTDQVNGGTGADTLTMLAGDYVPAGDDNLVAVETITSAVTSTLNLSSQSEGLTITGSANAQTITGGTGDDTITGGAGSDIIIRTTLAAGIDDIADFTTADDTLHFTKTVFALDSADGDVDDANEYVEVAGAAGDLSASLNAANDVIVLTNSTGFAGVAEVLTSIDGVAGNDALVVFYNSDTSLVTLAYDNDINDATAATIIGTFSSVTSTGIAAAFASTDFVLI